MSFAHILHSFTHIFPSFDHIFPSLSFVFCVGSNDECSLSHRSLYNHTIYTTPTSVRYHVFFRGFKDFQRQQSDSKLNGIDILQQEKLQEQEIEMHLLSNVMLLRDFLIDQQQKIRFLGSSFLPSLHALVRQPAFVYNSSYPMKSVCAIFEHPP